MNISTNDLESRAGIVKQILLNRRSVRQYRDKCLKSEHLNDIIEAAVYAPSGSNAQNQRFLVIEDKEDLHALGRLRFVWPYPTAGAMRQKRPAGLIGGAAAAIVVFADAALTDGRDNGEYYIWESLEIQNCSASIENMLNMAAALGIGSCWLSASERMSRTRLLSGRSWGEAFARYDVPHSYKVQAVVILGYPRGGLDKSGFPKGEKAHGATFWQGTARRPLDYYLVKRRELVPEPEIQLAVIDRLALSAASKAIGLLLWMLRKVESLVYDIEIRRALADVIARRRAD